MKRFLSCMLVAMLGCSIIGCRAEVDTTDDDMDRNSSYKKTTSVKNDGDTRTTKTEVRKND